MQHIEKSLDKIREIFQKASDRIEALKVGQKIPATVLAEEIAKDYGITGPQLYPVLLYLIRGYPDVEIKKGAHGGIVKLAPSATIDSDEDDDYSPALVDVKEDILDEDKMQPIVNT